MDMYLEVRMAHFDEGRSRRSIARDKGLSRWVVDKMCGSPEPMGYQRTKPIVKPKLDGFTAIIDHGLEEDKSQPRKQRHTAKRIWERLRAEHGFLGGYTIIKDYVREYQQHNKEVFMPLAHPPGHAQADFGEAEVILGGVRQKVHFFVLALPFSDCFYVRGYEAAVSEAWMDGHVHAFNFFGAVPQSILYDNDRCLVVKIHKDGQRRRTLQLQEAISHYLFKDRYGRPGRGNDKGTVEGLVGYSRRNFMVPVPEFASLSEFNAYLEECCREDQARVLRGHTQSKAQRLIEDLAAMKPLPARAYEPCHKKTGTVTSQALVRYRGNDYSVPTSHGHRKVNIRGFVDRVDISCQGEVIARHKRCYGQDQTIFNPVHYFSLLERKVGAFEQAAPLASWDMPEELKELQRVMEQRNQRRGRREFIQVLRLLETTKVQELCLVVRQAFERRAVSFDAIRHLLLCHQQRQIAHLNPDKYPFVPRTQIAITKASSYMELLQSSTVAHAGAGTHSTPQVKGEVMV